MKRSEIIAKLQAKIRINGHILGVAAGSGIAATYAIKGGADFILALSAGKYRQMGRSSLASLLCYANSNELVKEYASKEILPIAGEVPVIFGMNATDPTINLKRYLLKIREWGFSGINNFPTIGLIDGEFRNSLEDEGITFEKEVEAIYMASALNLFTVAYVFDKFQASEMIMAGADIICAHLGLTGGGILGSKSAITLERAADRVASIFEPCVGHKKIIRMIYGGPIKKPEEAAYIYEKTCCQGFIGGSAIDRIPVEVAILNAARSFSVAKSYQEDKLYVQVLSGKGKGYNYVDFVKNFIEENYDKEIKLGDLAMVAHISPTYLSIKFKSKTGVSFSEYLVRFRIKKAKHLLITTDYAILQIAQQIGYKDCAHFSKIFKKYTGYTPKTYRERKSIR